MIRALTAPARAAVFAAGALVGYTIAHLPATDALCDRILAAAAAQ